MLRYPNLSAVNKILEVFSQLLLYFILRSPKYLSSPSQIGANQETSAPSNFSDLICIFFDIIIFYISRLYCYLLHLKPAKVNTKSSCVNLISKLSHAFLILDNFEVPKTGVIPAGCFRIHANKT